MLSPNYTFNICCVELSLRRGLTPETVGWCGCVHAFCDGYIMGMMKASAHLALRLVKHNSSKTFSSDHVIA